MLVLDPEVLEATEEDETFVIGLLAKIGIHEPRYTDEEIYPLLREWAPATKDEALQFARVMFKYDRIGFAIQYFYEGGMKNGYHVIAERALQLKDYSHAEAIYQNRLSKDGLLRVATAAIESGEFRWAYEAYHYLGDKELLSNLGYTCLDARDFHHAQLSFQQAKDREGSLIGGKRAIEAGELKLGIDMLIDTDDREELIRTGLDLLQRKQFNFALYVFKKIDDTSHLIEAGNMAIRVNDLESASWAFRYANNTEGMHRVGEISFERGDFVRAVLIFDEIGSKDDLINTGVAALQQYDLDWALRAFKAAGAKDHLIDVANRAIELKDYEVAYAAYKHANDREGLLAVGKILVDEKIIDEKQLNDDIITLQQAESQANEENRQVKDFKKKIMLNEHLDVVLENNGKTHVYIDGKQFIQCMRLLLTIPLGEPPAEIISIDEAAENFGTLFEGEGMEPEAKGIDLDPEVEFFGHCSNLQAWVEHDYDTRLLHSNIAFPLLKQLANVGDEKAKRVLQAELEDRLQNGTKATKRMILETCGDLLDAEIFNTFLKDFNEFEQAVICTTLACHLNDSGNHPAAITASTTAINIRSYHFWAWDELGRAYLHLGDYPAAIKHFRKAISFNPRYANAWNNMSVAMVKNQEFSAAIAAAKEAIHSDAWSNKGMVIPGYITTLGEAYEAAGQIDQAVQTYQEALELDPSESYAIAHLTRLGKSLHDNHPRQLRVTRRGWR